MSGLIDDVYADKTYFDFGISTERDGAYLNLGLVRNKESYGARGVAYDRYEIALPLAGDYAQIRAFLENALLEVPVLSLDQLSFRRKRSNDLAVETDARLSLHILRP